MKQNSTMMNRTIEKSVNAGLGCPFMKKVLLSLGAVIAFAWSASAQRYQGEVSYAYSASIGKFSKAGWNVQTVHGYRFNDYIFLGGGVGFIYTGGNAMIPVFANAKGYLGNSRLVNPFASIDLGYGIREKGGIYFSPALGVNIRAFRRLGIFMSVGYQHATMDDFAIKNLNIRVGLNF